MPKVAANGIELEYDTFGDAAATPLVLSAGAGSQMVFWHERFCDQLASRGFFVVRYDSRDVGLSTKLDHLGTPEPALVRDRQIPAPYTMDDMAADAVGLFDALGLPAVHFVGISMGGYVGQVLAADYPDRLLSFVSMESALGGEDMLLAKPEDRWLYRPRDLNTPEARLDHIRQISGPHFDPAYVQEQMERIRSRGTHADGVTRHHAAVSGSPSRKARLASTKVPTLVIHGALDRLLPVENAYRTAAAIPGAKLLVLDDLGHELPPPLWTTIIDAIVEHARSVETATAST